MTSITKKIGSIKFSCISPEEIRRMSAVKVITADTYNDEGRPIVGGLMDPAMGVIEPTMRCATCGCKVDECPGHFGHIELAMPVIHVGFVKDIKQMLESTCGKCGRLMLTEDAITARKAQLESIRSMGGDTNDVKMFVKGVVKEASKAGFCPWCGEERVTIKLDKPSTFRKIITKTKESADSEKKAAEISTENKKLNPKDIRACLERIPDSDLEVLGIDPAVCRPEWMVLTALPVPPVTVRPSITLDSGDRSEDDLTHKLVDVLRIN